MAAKLKLVAEPTFRAKVGIPRAGAEPVEVEFEFRHRTKSELDEFIKSRDGKSDIDSFLDMVIGWPGIEEEFNRANAEILLENRIGVALATYRTYVEELIGNRVKNSAR